MPTDNRVGQRAPDLRPSVDGVTTEQRCEALPAMSEERRRSAAVVAAVLAWIDEQSHSPEDKARYQAIGLDAPDNSPEYEQGYADALDRLREFLTLDLVPHG